MREDVWRERVLDCIDARKAEIVHDLADLVRVPSISGSDAENAIQEVLAGWLDRAGLAVDHWQIDLDDMYAADGFPGVEVERDDAWGLVGSLPGRADGSSLMFNAHVDVVPPGDPRGWTRGTAFDGTVDAAVVYGRGACDMKGGLVAALWAARAIAETGVPLRGDLIVACVQGEEDGGLGTFATLQRGWRADACIIPEPTSLDISPANAGSLTFRLHVPGLATHASRRMSGVSAVEKFATVFQAIRRLEAERNVDAPELMAVWDLPYPIEIGIVRSGEWASMVPDRLIAEGRFGVALGEDVGVARAAFESAIEAACASDRWLRDHPVEVEWWGGQFAPGLTPPDASVLSTVRQAHQAVSAHPQRTWGTPYGSDLRLLVGRGIPTVHYGPGDAKRAHALDEWVGIDEVLTATRALALAAITHCGLG